MLRVFVLFGIVMGVVVTGCAKKSETVQTSETTTPQASTPTPVVEPPAAAGGSSAVLLSELKQQESELGQIIEQGRMGDVHGKIDALGALLKATPDRATDVPEASRARLRERALEAAKMADAIHVAGDKGDLSGTKTHFGHLQTELREIESILSAQP